jgi:hypothetical protein
VPYIETAHGPVTLSEEARDQLLDKIRLTKSGNRIVRAFTRAGLGEPVELDKDAKRLVIEAINVMSGVEDVDPQLPKLRDYLVDELDAGK